jgi:hypothetical protein
MKLSLLWLFVIGLAGCATTKTDIRNEPEADKYDPATTARIRLITGEGSQGGYVTGQSCETFYDPSNVGKSHAQIGWNDAHPHSAGIYPWRDSDIRNLVIGIPSSKASRGINETRLQYDEYIVPANKPLIVSLLAWSSAVSCRPKPISFIPEPGHDYEFQLEMVKLSTFRGGCVIGARQLASLGAGTPTIELPLMPEICLIGADGKTRTVNRLQLLEQDHKDAQQAH